MQSEFKKQRKFGTGGSTGVTYGGQNQINKPRTRFGSKFGYKLNAPDESMTKYSGKKDGGEVKELRKGGSTSINKPKTHHGAMQMPNAMLNKYIGHKTGGSIKGKDMAINKLFKGKETYAEELKEAKAIKSGKITPSQYAKGEKMEGHACGGKVKKMAKGGGIEVKGKTKGKMIVMKGSK